ncbi:MAG: Ppx/GppA family phosphatase [Thermoguttaceae bacterium]|nr:Ppx/GppA family phosphatase [Thermoguttaceae bacterium]
MAAIDLGANSLRMAIAEVFPDGRIDVLERLQRAVRLGQDTFRRGRLGAGAMRAAVGVLREYRRLLDLYKVERIRAVATSAVREASNADNFINRVFMATGLNLEVIATSEESRLTVSAVRRAVGDSLGINRGQTLVVDVGGGSTLLTFLGDGEIETSVSLRLGSIRLQEVLLTSEEPPERSADLLRSHIATVIGSVQSSLPFEKIQSFLAVGGDARFASREVGQPTDSADLVLVDRAELDKLIRRCERHTAEDLSKHYGLPYAEAETLVPALLVYQHLLRVTGIEQMIVSRVTMRDGLLLELAQRVTGREDQALTEGVIHSAMAIAEKYRVNLPHAKNVAELSVRLFDDLEQDHGLGPRYRLLLHVAGLLHEVGSFVSNQAHHKHSYYLIAHSEIFGLNRAEIELVAHIARYHRRSPPKPSHAEYMALPRESRIAVNKLAAILRVADALVRGPGHPLEQLRFEHGDDELFVYVPSLAEFMLEQRALAVKGDMFEEVYGMRLRLDEGLGIGD